MHGQKAVFHMALPVLPRLMALMSPELRDSMARGMASLARKAEETENPVDDVVLGILMELLGFDPPE